MQKPTVAVLFARADSLYKKLPGTDVWDEERNATKWPGGAPIVAHPPCRLWGGLRHRARASNPQAERMLAIQAVNMIRIYGGVLEHPENSTLWPTLGLPEPGHKPDEYGGYTLQIKQQDFGHRAEKPTRLYIVGCPEEFLPVLPPKSTEPATHVINHSFRKGHPKWRPECTKAEREATPAALAEWLLETARRCWAHKSMGGAAS